MTGEHMATAEQVANTGGEVVVRGANGTLTFLVRELSVEGELGLAARLRILARERLGPGGLMANVLPVARWLREQGEHEDAARLVQATAPLVAGGSGVGGDAAEAYRQSPAGVAFELFTRTRETHPDATEAEFRSVITEVNAVETYLAILRALDPKKAATPSGSPRSS